MTQRETSLPYQILSPMANTSLYILDLSHLGKNNGGDVFSKVKPHLGEQLRQLKLI
jgi:hypothetical protein